jgi:hypothetical protein
MLSNPTDLYDLGSFDAVVSGGGIRGVMKAAQLAVQGKKTLILEKRGGCLWEIVRSRWVSLDLQDMVDPNEPEGLFLDMLIQANGYKNGVLEPCITEMTADKLLERLGVQMMFESSFIQSEANDYYVALKGKIGIVHASEFYSTICKSSLQYTIWGLTLLDGRLPQECEKSINIQGIQVPIKITKGFYEDEILVYVLLPEADPRTRKYNSFLYLHIESIMHALRELDSALEECKLAHISDEPLLVDETLFSSNKKGDIWDSVKRSVEGLFTK